MTVGIIGSVGSLKRDANWGWKTLGQFKGAVCKKCMSSNRKNHSDLSADIRRVTNSDFTDNSTE